MDWRINENLVLTFKEANLYSGENTNIEPKYMLPNFLFFFLGGSSSKRPGRESHDRREYMVSVKTHFQFNFDMMLDDLITNRVERGITEKNNFGIVLNASYMLKKTSSPAKPGFRVVYLSTL